MNCYKICTVVVTYNRYSLLQECLDALSNQTYPTDIAIVDNASTDGTPTRLQEDGYLDVEGVRYFRLEENIGGAGGFYEGVKVALEGEYDFVWLMDDDAEPAFDALEILLRNIDQKYCAYAPAIFSGTKEEYTVQIAGHRGYFDFAHPLPMLQKPIDANLYKQPKVEIEMASFVGILIPITNIKKIGLPKKEFFIHYDDTEYNLRLKEFGKILMPTQSRIYHKEKRQEEKYIKTFLWMKKPRVKFEKLWIKYYGARNSVYLAKRYATTKAWYWELLKIYLVLIKDIMLFDDNKLKRIHFATASYLDGLRGVFDNEKPKKILGYK